MGTSDGRSPLILLGLFLLYLASRSAPHEEGPPAFLIYQPPPYQVALQDPKGHPKIHQYFDDDPDVVAKQLTKMVCGEGGGVQLKPVSGAIYLLKSARCDHERVWIPASQRMALQIPLHPERMTPTDWQALPGLGPRLAASIEENRQISGGFYRLEALKRVKGIGPKRILRWKEFF